MSEKIQLAFPIIVEGKYDQIKLASLIDGTILTTTGFRIFKDEEKAALLRKLAEKTPLIILTDSDHAGQMIRGHIGSLIPQDRLIQLYVPQVRGKEKRKEKESAEGYLGVEGIDPQILKSILAPYSVELQKTDIRPNHLKTADLYALGLTGRANSQMIRDSVARQIGLPQGMTANSFRVAAELLIDLQELKRFVQQADKAD